VKVVLRTDVSGVGNKGDVVDIADGFAQNKLIPQGMAFKASPGAEREAENMRKARELKASEERAVAEEMASRMQDQTLLIQMKAGEGGKLFGSVTAADISSALSEQKNITLDRKAISIDESIKETGTYSITVKPHQDVQFILSVDVVAEGN
tara:strand:+ start:564 stop:1016 length:453 start_codon:yes stop_codon:yes gene_type:complete